MSFERGQVIVVLERGRASVRLRERPLLGAGAFWASDFMHVFGDAGDRSGMVRLSTRKPRVMTGTGLHHWSIARALLPRWWRRG